MFARAKEPNAKGLQDVVNQAKSLVQRLREKESAVDVTLKDVNTLSEHLIAIRQFREDAIVSASLGKSPSSDANALQSKQPPQPVVESNSDGENQNRDQLNQKPSIRKQEKPFLISHQPLVLALLSENRRLAALEAENADLVKCLEEYQSALDMIMHKYRSHVTKFAATNQILTATIAEMGKRAQAERTTIELKLLERINDMAGVMRKATEMDDRYYVDVVQLVTRLHSENKLLRELLDSRVTGKPASSMPPIKKESPPQHTALAPQPALQPPTQTVSQMLLNGVFPASVSSSSSSNFQSVIYHGNRTINNSTDSSDVLSQSMPSSTVVLQATSNGLPYRVTTGASSHDGGVKLRTQAPSNNSAYVSPTARVESLAVDFKLPRIAVPAPPSPENGSPNKPTSPLKQLAADADSVLPVAISNFIESAVHGKTLAVDLALSEGEESISEDDDSRSTASSVSSATSLATLCPQDVAEEHIEQEIEAHDSQLGNNSDHRDNEPTNEEIDALVDEMMNMDGHDVDEGISEASGNSFLDSTTTAPSDVTVVEPASS